MGMAGSTAYATTKALGGNTQLANATKELTDIIRDKITNSADFSSILFNSDSRDALLKLAKGRTTLGFVQDAARIVGKTAGISAVRAGPMLSIEQSPDEAINATQPTGLENMTTEQIQQMLQQME